MDLFIPVIDIKLLLVIWVSLNFQIAFEGQNRWILTNNIWSCD